MSRFKIEITVFLNIVLYGLDKELNPLVFHSPILYLPYSTDCLITAGRTSGKYPSCPPCCGPGPAS